MKKVVIFGANSDIAEKTAELFAKKNSEIFLISRNLSRLKILSKDLEIKGANKVYFYSEDLTNFTKHRHLSDLIFEKLKIIDVIIFAQGHLPNQEECEQNFDAALNNYKINSLSVISLIILILKKLENQSFGSIAVVTSVAGDRGRKSNFFYGSAKAMLSVFLQGLRHKLINKNINIIEIKPGIVKTKMTRHLAYGITASEPEKIANIIYKSIKTKKNVVYAPSFWRIIMALIKIMPSYIFHKINF